MADHQQHYINDISRMGRGATRRARAMGEKQEAVPHYRSSFRAHAPHAPYKPSSTAAATATATTTTIETNSPAPRMRNMAPIPNTTHPATTGMAGAAGAKGRSITLSATATQPRAGGLKILIARHERPRFLFALLVTLLYIALLTVMLSASGGQANLGLSIRPASNGAWIVSDMIPAGIAYDSGIRLGDRVLAIDGVPVDRWATTGGEIGLDRISEVQLEGAGGQTRTVNAMSGYTSNTFQRWGYSILGILFVFVGGPVYIKARQRKAALTFYAFCIASAFALAAAAPIALGYGWVLAFMFISLLCWSATFASFFLIFPVPAVTQVRKQVLLFGSIATAALGIMGAYAWVYMGHADSYPWVRLLMMLYLGGCVIIGLARLGWALRTERDPDIRRQLRLLLAGTGFAVGPTLLLSVLPSLVLGAYLLHPYISALALGIMPLAFAYAITQHQLLGMSGFVRRSVVYIVLGFSVVLAFSFAATSLQTVVPSGWESEELGILSFGVFVFLLALSFGYLQKRVERIVDRFIYHDAYDYKQELLQFSNQLAAEQNLETLSSRLVERTCRRMNLSCGILLLSVDPNDAASASVLHTRYSLNSKHNLENIVVDGEPLYPGSNNQTLHDEGEPYLLPYMQYGDCAPSFLETLKVELSSLGIDLRYADAPTRLFYVSASARHPYSNTTDTFSDNKQGEESNRPLEDMRSFVGVPLWTRQKFVGVLCLGPKKTGERFTRDDVDLLSTLGAQAALAIYNAQLYEMREQALLDTITALAHAIEAKDTYTINHCEKITGRAVALAERLGLPRTDVENIRLGSILHDVGKIGVPDAILNKPSKLTPDEYELIKEHSTIGARIVQSVGALQGVVPIVRHHQERYDGSGYPSGLRGEMIPLGARIIAVADAYGAMTEDRIYRKAPGHEIAIAELKRYAGTQFDPNIAQAFIQLLEEEPDLAE